MQSDSDLILMRTSNFLVTGGAGFIGSHIVKRLLQLGAQKVRVIDNLSTGNSRNLKECLSFSSFEFIKGDIRDPEICKFVCQGIDYVCHQAALGSVPRSFNDPLLTHMVNADGFLNILHASVLAKVKRMVYASSSSVYGDSKQLPKMEEQIGTPISPYAVSKYTNELYAHVFSKSTDIETIGLRYFNVFGPYQNPKGPYAAVIPIFVNAVISDMIPTINGDGKQTRDFTYVENVVDANINALLVAHFDYQHQVFNIATGNQCSVADVLKELNNIANKNIKANFTQVRNGDIAHSLASIEKAKSHLKYLPKISFNEGLKKTYDWFDANRHFFDS